MMLRRWDPHRNASVPAHSNVCTYSAKLKLLLNDLWLHLMLQLFFFFGGGAGTPEHLRATSAVGRCCRTVGS